MTINNLPTDPVAIYRIETGEIVSVGGIQFVPEFKEQQISAAIAPWGADSHALVEGEASADSHYVSVLDEQATVTDRPELIVIIEDDKTTIQADGVDETTLTGLPNPCEIILDAPDPTVETQRIEVTGGGFIFSAETPGVYTIEVIRFPFLPWKVEITAL